METLGLYEPEELSLFGGELLMGLGSPLEPDQPNVYPYDGVEGTGVVELLGKDLFSHEKRNLTTSTTSPLAVTSIQDQASCLDLNWLDTKLDLNSLLHDNTGVEGLVTPSGDQMPAQFNNPIDNVPEFSLSLSSATLGGVAEVQPISAEDLLNQICNGSDESDSTKAAVVVAETNDNLLTEVFDKLSSEIEHIVNSEAIDVSDLGQGALSPVSIDDIESLLSSPVSPAASDQLHSPADASSSCLESLLTSTVNSPSDDVSFDTSIDTDESEAGPLRSNKSRRRSKPYQDSPPLDKKERKKLQNKTAALKYRQKKKVESESREDTCTKLEARNKELRDKVDSITREIQYLKDLMSEVVKAKGIKV